jgi:filamentous hemagglutinin
VPLTAPDSWSYRLIAGADQSSADVMAVDADVEGGNFTIAAGTGTGASPYRVVRTGNGSIDVAAAGDFILGNKNSVLYTAGVASAQGTPIGQGPAGLGGRNYPVDGGDIDIEVQGDIQGAPGNQLVTDWLWRVGSPPGTGFKTGWTVNFARFEQNVGALGGGDVNVSAGGDIRNFSVSIPTIGRQMSPASSADSVVDVIGGGNLNVHAGGDIEGGSFYVGRGIGNLHAGGDVTTGVYPTSGIELYPVLALGDGQWNVMARGSAGIEAIVNPTLLPQSKSHQNTNGGANSSFFSTYTDGSAVNIRSVSGDTLLSNDTGSITAVFDSMPADSNTQVTFQVAPPRLHLAALSGDVSLGGEMTLYPAPGSTVELLAEDSVLRDQTSPILQLRQSDANRAALPTVQRPHVDAEAVVRILGGLNATVADQHASTPVHAGDDSVARIVARTGDVSFQSPDANDTPLLQFSTPARVVAGDDIVDLPLTVQHDELGDITSLVAGGDIRYVTSRSREIGSQGAIQANRREIVVDGPGLLQLAAVGDVDLQTSVGISTRGNVVNTNLPDGGASVSVMAGASETAPDYAAVISRYLELETDYESLVKYVESITGETKLSEAQARTRWEQFQQYQEDLVAYVEARSGRDDLTPITALAEFRTYSRPEQREFMERVTFSELRLSGTEAVATDSKDYRRAFTALETLFPGANPDTEAGETNPYAGNIAMYFSRIYTLDGGDISLLTPGGDVNVGLAAPPASYGLTKGAAELGLVVQRTGSVNSMSYRDFAVNESRVFAADGGNIMVWSTDGDIDAGRGAKTAISAPAPTISFDENGRAVVDFPPALTGSGIQTLASTPGTKQGKVSLFAPRGIVNAGDAGIRAGDLVIGATAVLGADNIQVSGVAIGTPVDTGGLGASLASVSAVASSASNSATDLVDSGEGKEQQAASLGDTALTWLEVFVVGLGEDTAEAQGPVQKSEETTGEKHRTD